jgi:hypothetical protein
MKNSAKPRKTIVRIAGLRTEITIRRLSRIINRSFMTLNTDFTDATPDLIDIYLQHVQTHWSLDCIVGIATSYGLDDRVPVGSRIFSTSRRPDQIWGPQPSI